MLFKSEQDLAAFAENLGQTLEPPLVFELIGDVGAGKTTFTRALARGLGITEPVTSPSFTISNRYSFKNGSLIHYDFYRLSDPGLMREELREALSDPQAIVILEWANSVKNILPANHVKISFSVLDDGSRKLSFNGARQGNSFFEALNRVRTCSHAGEPKSERAVGVGCPHPRGHDGEHAKKKLLPPAERFSLYLDTSDFITKIQLTDETGQTFSYEDNLGREMAEKLLETLELHLKDHGKTWKDLKKITFMSGPGSFTGLRIGAAIVNTLAHELHIPLYDHHGTKHQIILPDYGRPANISAPRK